MMNELILEALLYILPAYIANSSAVVFGGGFPLDMGKSFRGKRILGDGKTVKGTFFGIVCGSLTGFLVSLAINNSLFLFLGLLVSTGAILGDIFASLLKRRSGVDRGGPVPVLDQLDFVIGAVLLGSVLRVPSLEALTLILIVTPFIHLFTNVVGYFSGLKDKPW